MKKNQDCTSSWYAAVAGFLWRGPSACHAPIHRGILRSGRSENMPRRSGAWQAKGPRHGVGNSSIWRRLGACVALLFALPAFSADDALMRAMRDELSRSMRKLQLENLQKPYFVGYRIVESSGCSATASFGALTGGACQAPEAATRTRMLNVEVRVGDYARDNTNFFAPMMTSGVIRIVNNSAGNGVQVPVDDNYDELRRQLWLATDSAYKTALDSYAKKKASLEHRTREEDTPPDFSKEPVVTVNEADPPLTWIPRDVQALVKSLSAVFREQSAIDNSDVRFSATRWTTWYANSEGTTYTRAKNLVQLQCNADTQAADGMPLVDFDVAYANTVAGLPSRDEMLKRIRALAARITAARKAPPIDRYSGPVLFESQAAAELFFQSLAGALTGAPRTVTDAGVGGAIFTNLNANAGFADRIGARVLPDFLSIKDAPTAKEFKGQPLFGGYDVDDEGVKAGETSLVDRGMLQTLLHSRSLIPNTTHSTASRRAAGVMPSNLLFTADKPLTNDQLKAELLRIVKQRNKEYGVIVRRMNNQMLSISLGRARVVTFSMSSGPASLQVEPALEAYKVFPDGHEELVRNLNINGLTLDSFKSVVAVSEPSTVYTAPTRPGARLSLGGLATLAQGSPNVVSANVPSMLFEDLTLQKPSGDVPVLPFSTHPYFEK
jgi:predicted Zn-dependent protease